MLNYSYPQVTLQEIPGEISLALSISGCSLKCKGCHSSFTWDNQYGKELSKTEFLKLLDKNQYISTVLFYGGEWNLDYLEILFEIIKERKLKIALYSGEELTYFSKKTINKLDFLKTGKYIEELGGLSFSSTNQKLYEIKDGNLEDISIKLVKN